MKMKTNTLRRWLLGFVGLSFCCMAVLSWMGCPSSGCKQDSDCTAPQVCVGGTCSAPTETPTGEQGGEKAPTDAGETTSEPPPLPDTVWKEGRLPAPDTLQNNQPVPTTGTRKAGETCNPQQTALPEDRCEDKHLCAPTSSGSAGICLPACDPKGTSCAKGARCVEIRSLDLGTVVGTVCAPTQPLGYPCSQSKPCEDAHVCMAYGSSYQGLCRKACTQVADCGDQWCYSANDITGQKVTGCSNFGTKADDPCPPQTVCDSGLNCYGSTGSRLCLKNCTQDKTCPDTHTCKEVKDSLGKVLYSLCFRNVKAGEACNATTQCEKDHLCLSLASNPSVARCVRDCSQDEKVCTTGTVCDTVESSSTTKVCYREAQEGQPCEGEVRCAQGLSCQPIASKGPRHCMKVCDSTNPCSGGKTCLPLNVGDAPPSLCLLNCDPKASDPCPTGQVCTEGQATSPVCLPDPKGWAGSVIRGNACSPHFAAPVSQRCLPTLQCVELAEGWRCLQICDPANPSCPTGESCGKDHRTGLQLCASAEVENKECHVANSKLCGQGLRCHQQMTSSQGSCIKPAEATAGGFCHPDEMDCAEAQLCSGDPKRPFRWICRGRCKDGGSPACPSSQTCLPTVGGSNACFAPCDSKDACSNKLEQCTEIQNKRVCM